MSHKSRRTQDNLSTETQQKASEKESNNRHVYVEPGVQIDLVKDLRKTYEASQAEGTNHNKKQLFWTKVSAGLLFVYAALNLWQGYSAKRTADSALIDQRPYVVIKFPILTPKFIPSVPLLTAVDVVNIGRTPAIRMGDIIDLVYFPPPTRRPGDEYIME